MVIAIAIAIHDDRVVDLIVIMADRLVAPPFFLHHRFIFALVFMVTLRLLGSRLSHCFSTSIRRSLHRLLHALVQGKVYGFAEEGGLLVVHARGLLLVVVVAQALALAIDPDLSLPLLPVLAPAHSDVLGAAWR